jgi:carboxylesterase
MSAVQAEDWRATVTRALEALEGPVCVAGLSMGALLTLDLAARFPEKVARIALLAPAFELQDPMARLVRKAGRLPVLEWRGWVGKDSVDLENPSERAAAPIVPAFPARRLRDLWAMQEIAAEAMGRIEAPALVVMGEQDHVVDGAAIRRGAKRLAERVPTRFIAQKGAAHLLPRDFGRHVLEAEVAQHFRAH